MSVRVLIVDDERLARVRIASLLHERFSDAEIKEAGDGFLALDLIEVFRPDIVFLDIEMPVLSGFDLLRQLSNRDFQVVFQTAYDQFAIEAFAQSACDYLLKPFSDERLEEAYRRAIKRQTSEQNFKALDRQLIASGRYLERLIIKVGRVEKFIEATEVFYFKSEHHFTHAFTVGRDYIYENPLDFLELNLDPKRFARIHRNSMVNLAAVTALELGPPAMVRLKDGTCLNVSRQRLKPLRERFFALTKMSQTFKST